jgi:multiple sugar transport system permease protein
MRLLDNRRFLIFLFMLPAAGLLIVFLTYPLGLGVWLGFTDTRIGRSGVWIGWENYVSLFQDRVFWIAVEFTIIYTVVATIGKFALGLWLALLLNHAIPFKAFVRSIILVPWIVPTVLSAIAFWWIYDPQFSIISYSLERLGLIDRYIDFLGVPENARASLIVANIWRGIPFVAICLLAGLQTISPSLYEAAMIDGANAWQRFWHITLPMLMPILAVVLTFSVLFTFTDFQLVYAITRGGPVNSTHLMATLAFQRAIPGGQLGEGAAIAVAMIPFLVFATCFSYFALARRKWQQGEGDD